MVEPLIGGAGYGALLTEIKAAVAAARVRAARVVNYTLVQMYWQIGQLILQRQNEEGWGTRVIDRLSVDLRTEIPGMRGLSTRNLVYMRTFAAAYPDGIAQRPAAQLPWRHIMVLLDKVPDPAVRDWYAAQDVQHGWSSAVLSHHIATGRHARVGRRRTTSRRCCRRRSRTRRGRSCRTRTRWTFLALEPRHSEHDLEDALVARLTRFLSELGTGFAFVGRQYKVTVASRDYYIDCSDSRIIPRPGWRVTVCACDFG